MVLRLHLEAEEKLSVHREDREGGILSYLSDAGVGVSNLHDHREGRHAHLMSEDRVLASLRSSLQTRRKCELNRR